jgi:hypothetical protein
MFISRMTNQQKILELIQPLFNSYREEIIPADEKSLDHFRSKALRKGVPDSVIEELISFYSISDGVPCLDSFDFHRCNDEILFEWWNEKELWLAQRDFYVLRWSQNKFCLGDASNRSFSTEYEFDTLRELLEFSFREWHPQED